VKLWFTTLRHLAPGLVLVYSFLEGVGFFSDLGIKYEDYQEIAADYLEDFLRDSGTVSFQNLSEETLLPVLDYLYRVAEKNYAGKAGYDRVRFKRG